MKMKLVRFDVKRSYAGNVLSNQQLSTCRFGSPRNTIGANLSVNWRFFVRCHVSDDAVSMMPFLYDDAIFCPAFVRNCEF